MSTTIDQRVVEMQFDNKHFEQNVQTSMSTLEKLKRSLKLDDAAKGFDNVSAAAKKVDMTGLGNGVETVRAKFSALEVIGVTALANITNSAVNAGKRMLSALTIDPIKTGFSEYELKMDSVKTIMASTGESVETVNGYLNELNEYSDQTIYSFADMTQNIGKFTNAGVKLEDAVLAIKGISNEAAVSGANANEASRAMYNFAQALSAGYVKLIDWKSIENANMATVEFKQQLIDTAVELGTVTEAADGMYETIDGHAFNATRNFNDVLQDQWMTTDVLVTTLGRYADKTTDIGRKAFAAAQDVTKFTQVWDILKETAQSGWSRTWELIVGDINQAKALLTPLTNFLSDVINKISDFRNGLIGGAFNTKSMWASITEKFENSGLGQMINAVETVSEKVNKAKRSIEDFQDIVNKVWRGDYNVAHGTPDRYALLEAEGWDHRVVQDLVNKTEGSKNGNGLTIEDVEASYKKFGVTMEDTAKSTEKTTKAVTELADEQLKAVGLTEEEIKLYRDLEKEAARTGKTIEEIVDEMSKKDGRTLFIEAFKNAGQGLVAVFKALKDAWVEIFPPMSVVQLYNIIKGMNDFSQHLKVSDETAGKLKRTFKGVFAIVDILTTILGGGFKIAFKILQSILSYFNLDILEFTALIGDALVKVRDWFDGLFDISWILEAIVPWISECAKAIGNWFKSLKETKLFKAVSEYLSNMATSIKEWFASFDAVGAFKKFIEWLVTGYNNFVKWITAAGESDTVFGKVVRWFGSMAQNVREFFQNFDAIATFKKFVKILQNGVGGIKDWFKAFKDSEAFNVAKDIIAGLVEGLKSGASTVWNAAVEMAKNLWIAVKDFLGIHSPATRFIEIAEYIIDGLIVGLRWGTTKVMDAFRAVVEPVIDWIKSLDLGIIFATALAGGSLWFLKQIGDFVGGIGAFFGNLGDIINTVEKVGKSLSTALKAEAAKSFATALLILAGAIAILAYIASMNPWALVGAVGALVVIMGALAGLIFLMGKVPKERTIAPFGVMMLSLAGAMLALALLCNIIAPIKWGDLGKAAAALGVLAILVGALVFVATKISTNIKALASLAKLGDVMLKVGITIGIVAIALKIISGISSESLKQAVSVLSAIAGLVGVLIVCVGVANLLSKNTVNDFGKIMTSIGASILMLAIALKIITSIPENEVWHAFGVLSAIVGLVGGLMVLTGVVNRLSKNKKAMTEFGKTMLGVGAALLMMTIALKIITSIPENEVWQAFGVLAAISGLVAGLMLLTNLAPKKKLANVATTLLALAGCIGILAALCVILGLIDPSVVWKGYAIVAALTVLVMGLVFITKYAKNIKGTLVVLAVVIGLLAGAIAGLSFIKPEKLWTAVAAMTILMGMFALMTSATKKVSKSYGALIVLGAAVALIAGVLYAMSELNVENAVPNATAVGIAMLAMAGSLRIISKINKTQLKNAPSAILALTAMVVPLLVFAGAIRGIQAMGINESVITPLLIISAAIAAMALLLVPLTLIGTLGGWQSLIGVLALTAMVVPLIAFAGAIRGIQAMGIDNSIVDTLMILAHVMTAMTILLIPLTVIGAIGWAALIGVLALTAMVVPLLAFAGGIWLIGKMNLSSAMPVMEQLVELIVILTDMLVKVALVAPLALVAVAAIGALEGVLVAFGIIAGVVGALVSRFPQLEEFIDTGIPIMEKLAAGIGSILGKFITSLVGEVLTLIPQLGAALGGFMEKAEPFIEGAKTVDEKVLSGVGYLAGAIALLCAADLLDNISTFMGFGEDFSGLGTKLADFIKNVLPGFEAMEEANISPETISSVKTLAEALLLLTGTELLDQISNMIFGQSNEESFSNSMISLAGGLKAFGEASADIDLGKLQNGVDALKMLVDASQSIPDQEWYVKLFPWGRGDEAVFGDGLASLGNGINAFATSCADINAESVAGGIDALKALIAVSEGIPDEAWYTKLFPWARGDEAVFGDGLTSLGKGINAFATSCADINAESVAGGCSALTSLISAASSIPDATWYEKIIPWADSDEEMFANSLSSLGKGINAFATECGDIDPEKVTAGASALVALAKASNNIPDSSWYTKIGIGKSDQSVFASSLKALGQGVADFYKAANSTKFNADKMNTLSTAITAIVKFASSAAGTSDNINLFTKALKKLLDIDASSETITAAIKKVAEIDTEALSSACSKIIDSMGTIAKDMVDSFIEGVEDNISGATEACTSLAEDCADAMSEVDFSGAGKDVVTGFAAGITDNTWRAEAKARAMARAAADAAKNELDINSPSKVFRAIGTSVPEGFAQGISKLRGMVTGSSRNMATAAVDSVKNTISNLARIVSSDIDTQPTIRPVMDLSGVRTGAAAIDGMLNSGSMLGVTANVNSINSAMNRRIQNGVSNRDVVSAIDKLNERLGNVGNTSYTINGITYDDGTNIANAVGDLIRYARIERRV